MGKHTEADNLRNLTPRFPQAPTFTAMSYKNPKDTAVRSALGELRPADGKPEGNLDSGCRDCILKGEGRKRGGRERKDYTLAYYRDV